MAQSDATFTPAGASTEASNMLANFWRRTMDEIKDLTQTDFKTQELPLARIKKIMKLDEDVKMISAEAPVLFAKAAEIFISELSLRAWLHTEDNKRRTLQRNDIAMAISKFDQFDFLIDIVPRDELKPAKRPDDNTQRTSMMPDQVQYYFQMTQQMQQQATQTQAAAPVQTAVQPQQVQLQAGQIVQQPGGQQVQVQLVSENQDQSQLGQTQVIQVQAPPQQQQQQQQPQPQQPAQQQQQQQPQQQTTQVFHRIVTPSGEVQNIPIQLTPAQLQAIQLQVQGTQPGQPIVIQTATTQAADQVQLSQPTQQPLFQIQQVGGQQVFIQQTEDGQEVQDS